MATSEEWAEVAERIRHEGGPHRSRSVRQLYDLAITDGKRLLASFKQQLGEDVLVELTHGLLAEKLQEILDADSPRALFATALRRRAISWLRRGDAQVRSADSEDGPGVDGATDVAHHAGGAAGPGEGRRFVFDALALLNSLSERDRQIAIAVGLGEDREEIAVVFNTSRANVDQIVSRLRRRLAEEDS